MSQLSAIPDEPINTFILEARLEELRQLEDEAAETSKLIWQTVGGVLIGLGALVPFTADRVQPGDAVILLYLVPVFCAIGLFEFVLWNRLADLGSERAEMRNDLTALIQRLGGKPDLAPFFRASGVRGPDRYVGITGFLSAVFPLIGLFPLVIFFRLERDPDDLQYAVAHGVDPLLICVTTASILIACERKRRQLTGSLVVAAGGPGAPAIDAESPEADT